MYYKPNLDYIKINTMNNSNKHLIMRLIIKEYYQNKNKLNLIILLIKILIFN